MFFQHRNLLILSLVAVVLCGCSSLKLALTLDELIPELQSQDISNNSVVDAAINRINKLEKELAGITIRNIQLQPNSAWSDIYSNQGGRDRKVIVELSCNSGTSCGKTTTSVRVLRVLADAELDREFPVLDDTVVIDTGPLDLTSEGSSRDLTIPRGFRVVAKADGPDPVTIRVVRVE